MRGNRKQIALILKQYRILKSELKNCEKIYNEYNKSKNILSTIDIGREGGRTNRVSSQTESMALYLADYSESMKKIELQISIIETALECLSIKEKHILMLKYFEELTWNEVANKLELCDKWCKEMRNSAFKKLMKTIPIEVFPCIFFD